ncbi:unnamed protein product [Zymoseptoria tritici ST99CH_3D7]|uniref:DUF1772 domain-containing protein n=1 Tax=Zymoseptoria tritici (strain ST99CH_3D7) TaxID=1276538 RepID=A0A1X7S5X5_ZYMT9|nr:unnamed protein product [Zymoseptoria tritici ST99CH_3D7]
MPPTQSNTTLFLQTFALTSTLSLATAMGTTSLLYIPSLLRPLTTQQTSTSPSDASSQPISRRSSALDIPALHTPSADGRLTPQPTTPNGHPQTYFGGNGKGGEDTYRAVAQQFALFDTLASRLQVPLEVLSIAAYSTIAIRAHRAGLGVWTSYAAAAGLLVGVFPFTGLLMAPLSLKVRRLGGDEEKVEPYEDAPLDREAERGNTVGFVKEWAKWNVVRTVGVLVAGVVGARAVVVG